MNGGFVKRTASGVGLQGGGYLLLLAACAALTARGIIPESACRTAVLLSAFLAAFLGNLLQRKKLHEKATWLSVQGTLLLLWLLLWLTVPNRSGRELLLLLCSALFGILLGRLPGGGKSKKGKRRRR